MIGLLRREGRRGWSYSEHGVLHSVRGDEAIVVQVFDQRLVGAAAGEPGHGGIRGEEVRAASEKVPEEAHGDGNGDHDEH